MVLPKINMARILVLGSLAESLITFRGSLLEEMVKGGHEVYACAPDATSEIRNTLSSKGVLYMEAYIERTGLNPIKDIQSIVSLLFLIKRIKPDVFLGYTPKPVIYGSFAARIVGVPKIFSMIEGLGYTYFNTGFKVKIIGSIINFLFRLALRFNHKVFFLNLDNLDVMLRKKILKNPGQATILNGIGVDLKKFTPAPYPNELTFLMIARLLRDKGVTEYIKAAHIVKRKYPEIRFSYVGWADVGNPNAISEEERQSLVDSDSIEYIDRLSNVRPAIAQSSVYVLPSYHEGMPVTVMEAMAMGRPVITTYAPGCRETVIQGKNGLLVPVKDANALAEAMEHFVIQPKDIEVMGRLSRLFAEEKFDVHKINAVMLSTMGLIDEVYI